MNTLLSLRHYTALPLILSLCANIAGASVASAQTADVLEGLQWKNRIILLFSKSRSSAVLDRQISILREYRPDLSERDLIVLRTAGREGTRSEIGYVPLRNGTNRQLLQLYEPAKRGLTVVLIGKDGGEKKRWNRIVQPEEIFTIIDAMPMRQQEMKSAGEG